MLRLLLQVALALGEIHVRYLGKLLCENSLAKSSERSVKGIRGFRERFKSVWLYPVGVAVARDVQFFPVGLLLEKGSFTRWVGCRSGRYPTEKPRADRRAVRVVRRMLITTDHLDLLSLVIVVSFCCSDVSRFMSAMMGGRPDDVAVPRQTLTYLTFAGLVNLLARLFRVNQPYQSAY